MRSTTAGIEQEAQEELLPQEPIFQIVMRRLREDIIRGIYPPGTPLRMDETAQRFGISLMPVREAFARLDCEGFLHMRPRRGAIVREVSEHQRRGIVDGLALLGGSATGLAVRRMDAVAVHDLQRMAGELEELTQGTDFDLGAVLEFHQRLHLTLYGFSGNDELVRTVYLYEDLGRWLLHQQHPRPEHLQHCNTEHREILQEIEREHPDKTEALMCAHLQRRFAGDNSA